MFIGIDVGGTNIKGLLTDKDGEILNYKTISTGKNGKEIEDNLHNIIFELSTGSISISELKAIGIGAAGAIDRNKGVIITSPNINGWDRYPLVSKLEGRTGKKIILENDATAAVVGEWWKGNGKKFKNWILLTLGTGIGGGAMIDNKIYTGQSGSSMEFGHMIIDLKGKKCACGSRGCLEQYGSATAAVKFAQKELKKYPKSSIHKRLKTEKLTSRILNEEADDGDSFSVMILEKVAEYLGIGVSNLINIFNPEAVIFGGGLSRAHKILFPIIKEKVKELALPGLKDNVKFLEVEEVEKVAAFGAAKLAIDFFDRND